LTLDEIVFTLDVVYYDVTIESKSAADESNFSSTPDLSFILSSTQDLSTLFTSEVLFLEYFEFYQHSTPVVLSNQILGILEVCNNTLWRLMVFRQVALAVYLDMCSQFLDVYSENREELGVFVLSFLIIFII
jgi:hypothetical protein